MGMLWSEGHTCAGGAGLAPPGLPAEVHGRLAFRHAALSCQAAGKAERTFAPKATGSGDSTQPVPVSASPSALQQPQPAAQEALESQPALQEKLKSFLDQRDGCRFLN